MFIRVFVCCFPHTPQDINTINDIFKSLSSEFKRNRLIVAPYNSTGTKAIQELFSYYLACDCIIGMRFHSLVTAMNLGIPAIALCGHAQIEALALDDFSIIADNLEFKHVLCLMVDNAIINKEKIRKKYMQVYKELEQLEEKYQSVIKKMLK